MNEFKLNNDFPILVSKSDLFPDQRWQIQTELLIGRDPDCQIMISDRQVSRWHARITLTAEGAVLEDLESKNGTFCNRQPVLKAVKLQDGDLIQVAMLHCFVYLVSDATVPMDQEKIVQMVKPCGLQMDLLSRRVWIRGQEIEPSLSASQFRLLQALYERPGQVVSREVLINDIWGEKESVGVSEQAFDALVRRLRERIAQYDPNAEYIVTLRGHGIRLDHIE